MRKDHKMFFNKNKGKIRSMKKNRISKQSVCMRSQWSYASFFSEFGPRSIMIYLAAIHGFEVFPH